MFGELFKTFDFAVTQNWTTDRVRDNLTVFQTHKIRVPFLVTAGAAREGCDHRVYANLQPKHQVDALDAAITLED